MCYFKDSSFRQLLVPLVTMGTAKMGTAGISIFISVSRHSLAPMSCCPDFVAVLHSSREALHLHGA